jgi:hypothetical protein
LLLYAFGIALLAGIGLEALPRPRFWKLGIVLLLVVELFIAGRKLAYNHPTAPAAFDSMRTAPAHILADESKGPFRFLSMSDILYDPGDLGDLQAMFASQLSEKEIYDLIVATKMKEVLAYNLPLRYRIHSVDGYDGGLLPVARYVTLERLFLAEEAIWPDGRLRQQLRSVPPSRLLSLLNVKYVITDKTQDIWLDNIYYDLEHTQSLGTVTLTDLPNFEATHLGVVSYLTGTRDLPEGTPVAAVTITSRQGTMHTAMLRAGEHTAEGLYGDAPVLHRQARVGHHWRDNEQGNDYIALLDLEQALQPKVISIHSLLPDGQLQLRGLTLIDAHTGTSRTLSVDPAYRLVHSGDVKIYENLSVLPRAFVVHQSRAVADDEQTLSILRAPEFDPARVAILATGDELRADLDPPPVDIVTYAPERIQLRTTLEAPGYLLLTEMGYPGWIAKVNGERRPILRADLGFRAVRLEAGTHDVTFRFRPASVRWGLTLGILSWLAWVLATAIIAIRFGSGRPHTGRAAPSSV